ncbi:hypothetical protein, partial [Amycolatopsis pittospori]|uniref:hypothetical protein n=1 Tax=Amycolatopsis pittospori TaxID=2749434 RepID=UPI001A9FA0B3
VRRRLRQRRRGRTTWPFTALTAFGRELLRWRLTAFGSLGASRTFRTACRAIGATGRRWRSTFAPGTACTLGRYTRLSFQRVPNPRCSTMPGGTVRFDPG